MWSGAVDLVWLRLATRVYDSGFARTSGAPAPAPSGAGVLVGATAATASGGPYPKLSLKRHPRTLAVKWSCCAATPAAQPVVKYEPGSRLLACQ